DLVAESLDHDRPVGRQDARGLALLAEVLDEVARRARVEVVRLLELRRLAVDGPAGELPDSAPELDRAADAVAAPERDRAGRPRCGSADHAVARDLLDPPGGGAEQERLSRPGLVDHLLVELADPPAVGQVDAVEPAIRDRPGVRDRELTRAPPRPDRVSH